MATQTVGQRISQLIAHLGISKNAFAASLDKTATVVQHLVDERNKPGFDLLCRIFEVYPNVSKDWLMQGVGSMLVTSSEPAAAPMVETVPLFTVEPTLVAPLPAAEFADPAAVASQPTPAPVAATPPVAPTPPVPAPVATLAPASVPAAPAATADASWQTALYTQQMAHQLAMAEMRNQHLQEQQRMMQQMMELMQRQLSV